MINYLYKEEIIEINRLCLEASNENEEFIILQQDDINFILDFASENFKKRSKEIKNIMKSEYGKYIEKWLRENFNEP